MCSLRRTQDARCADIMAGSGRISKYLPPGSLAVEIDPSRYNYGKRECPHIHWMNCDMFSSGYLDYIYEVI
eukprot:UN19853